MLGSIFQGVKSSERGLYGDDMENHYNFGAVWNGDWRKGHLLKGWFGNDAKPRHYAVSAGRQSARYRYPHALAFYPMTSLAQKEGFCLLTIQAHSTSYLPEETYILPIRLLMKEVHLDCYAEANFMGDLPADVTESLKCALANRTRSYEMEA